ncbi:MFS transporter [Hyphococcus luteus]|uniref:MFS transporter n=1 Tax=Hyphococcus luteus TaxID=2058213 RepID=A0A2S7K5A6_9PROT|nr:MFS transporter [Marinicaulis flavus]PQA87661.1 MFS transporter [Marinicaulis flavus]
MSEAYQGKQIEIGGLLDAPGAWNRRKLAPVLLGLLMLFDSWDGVMIAFVMPTLSQEWNLDPVAMGWLMSSGYAGQLVGALVLGAFAERWGRKPVYSIAVAIMCVFSLACALTHSPQQLAALRFIQGLAIGGAVPVCASYINEIAPTQTRGRFFSVFQFLMISGYGAAAVSSSFIIEHFGWRMMFLLGAAPLLVLPFSLALLPESPRWLARMGRFEAAVRAILQLGGPRDSKLCDHGALDEAPLQSEAQKARLSEIFSSGVRAPLGVMVSLWFLTSLVNYGLVNWVPSIYVSEFHIPVPQALRFSAISMVLVLFIPMLLGVVMDKVGRRPLAIAGTLAGGLVLLSLMLVESNVPLLVTLVVLGHTGIGIGTIILWPYSAEVFPTRVRALALGICSSSARTASMLTPLMVGGLIAKTGSVNPVFALFGALGVLVSAIWFFATRETKGVRVDEVA